MDLYLLRHGIAVEPDDPHYLGRDAERPLTKKGREKVEEIARALKRLDLSFDLILSSPSVRARDTAIIVAETLKLKNVLKLADAVSPSGTLVGVIDELRKCQPAPRSVLLVGHEPNFSEWVSVLISGNTSCGITFKKAGLCKLDVPGPLENGSCARLEWMAPPKLMARAG